MPKLKPPYQYVFDTSALLDLKGLYPERIFPGLWERFNEMCESGKIICPREVYKEIQKGSDELLEWADKFENIFLEPCEEEVSFVQAILSDYPHDILAKYSTRHWADPFVIACAKYYRLPVVQHETNDQKQFKIPTIARKHKIRCQRLIQFFDDEGWEFVSRN